jgi:hypothetical protein
MENFHIIHPYIYIISEYHPQIGNIVSILVDSHKA